MANPVSHASRTELLEVANAALAPEKGEAVAAGAAEDFCMVFKVAKPVLQALISIASIIPGHGQKAAAALTALIAVGDSLCPGS